MRAKNSLIAPLLIAIIFVFLLLSQYIDSSVLEYKDNIYLSIIILQLIIFVLPGIFYCKIKKTGYVLKLKMVPFPTNNILFVIFSMLLLILGTSILKLILYNFGINTSQYLLYNTYSPLNISSVSNTLYVIITFALVPAITEEFIFRGILITEYEGHGLVCSILITSVLFAMVHFNISQFIIYFFAGIIFAYVRLISKSVIAAMCVHLVNNLFGLFFESLIWKVVKQPNNMVFLMLIFVGMFLVFLFLSLSEAERICYIYGVNGKISPYQSVPKENKGRLFIEAILSPAFLGCIIIYVIVIFNPIS